MFPVDFLTLRMATALRRAIFSGIGRRRRGILLHRQPARCCQDKWHGQDAYATIFSKTDSIGQSAGNARYA